jgi:nicotinamidase-related amidase
VLVDTINPFDFPGGAAFARRSLGVARNIARLRERATRAGVPVIYVNDNIGRWRSDFRELIDQCTRLGSPGKPIVDLLTPRRDDYVVLKTTLSGFYETPLDTMLRLGGVRRLVLTGFAADNCVLFTAADAYMREYRLDVPRDCIGAKSPAALKRALATLQQLLSARTAPSKQLRLTRK